MKYGFLILFFLSYLLSNSQTKITSIYFDNLYKINDSIYRCEQPGNKDFVELENLGIRSVLNLRNYHSDQDGGKNSNLLLFRVKMNAHRIEDKDIIMALQILCTAPKPIVVHCKHGADRTGLIIAMYRIIYQNWTKEQAVNELVDGGYGFHPIFKNIPQYIQNVDIEKFKFICK